MKKLLVLGMAVALASAAFAYPTLTGPTGLATVPTAAVAPAGELTLAADWFDTEVDETIPIRVLYGVGENFEIGAGYFLQNDNDAWGVNAKYLTPLTLGGFAWALGAQYIDFTDADVTATQAYFAGTRGFAISEDGAGPALAGTLGVNWTQLSNGVDEDAFRFFAGLELGFENGLSIAAEYQTEDDDIETDPVFSAVVRYPFTPALSAQVGITNGPIVGGDDSNIFAGLSYAFGMGE